jgi:tRNA modification GTPase
MSSQDTIVAISTPPGEGAIAIARLSGPGSYRVCENLITLAGKEKNIHRLPANTIHYGTFHDESGVIDEVMVSLFRGPRSYTGEDSIEISCHGSVYIQQTILQTLIQQGARLAEPGEFTMRAFLNGKLDLSRAEAVADLIASRSGAAHRVALQQMRGGFSRELELLREKLLEFISLIELELDFSEEEVEFADRAALRELVSQMQQKVSSLVDSFRLGNAIKQGVPVAIAGKTNVGKSTLLNALLKEDRAIVSEIAGTTRDTIEDVIHLHGILFRFIDTAGIRHTTDEVEHLGIQRTFTKISQATVVMLVVTAGEPLAEIEKQLAELHLDSHQKSLVILNKSDQYSSELLDELTTSLGQALPCPVIPLSAKQQWNLHTLTETLYHLVKEESNEEDVIISNTRHFEALSRALEALERVSAGLENALPGDLLAQDIREVLHYLGEILGHITTDEILGSIFRNFCIGK